MAASWPRFGHIVAAPGPRQGRAAATPKSHNLLFFSMISEISPATLPCDPARTHRASANLAIPAEPLGPCCGTAMSLPSRSAMAAAASNCHIATIMQNVKPQTALSRSADISPAAFLLRLAVSGIFFGRAGSPRYESGAFER
jgi:hypothetical protein